MIKFSVLNILFCIFLNSYVLNAQEESGEMTVVAVGEAGVLKQKITIVSDEKLEEFKKVVSNDFAFYKRLFEVVDTGNPVKATLSKNIDLDYYANKNFSYVIQLQGMDTSTVVLKVFDIKAKKLVADTARLKSGGVRTVGHDLADFSYEKIQGKHSIFKTKIVFVSDVIGTKQNPAKELFLMDFDGHNMTQITHHNGNVISPSFSNDGKKIVYSLIRNQNVSKRNIDLLMYDIESKKSETISSLPGINSGAVFMAGDQEILLTLSHTGNAEIFKMNLRTRDLVKMTNHPAPDVDPSITLDGKLMAFLSGRPGRAEIYLMDPSEVEKNVRRISFVGDFNATPRFSNDGKEIVFSSWLEKSFDIFRINSDGTGLVRLTKDFGSNESPVFSTDGEFIAFSSQRVLSRREAVQNIYIMDKEGDIIGPATSKMGNCSSPRWSN